MVAHAFLECCVELGCLYDERFLFVTKQRCRGLGIDPWASLRFVLLGYAFERQGKSYDYAPAAGDTIDEFYGKRFDAHTAQRVWDAFARKLHNTSLNHANNPLCPKGTRYQRRYRGMISTAEVKSLSIIELVATVLGGQPIVSWVRDKIVRGETKAAHRTLRRINGVSNKIASLLLRDVATLHHLGAVHQPELLQPIDTWTRFVAKQVAANDLMSDSQCAAFLIENTTEPERANQGIWYFCSQIAESSRYRVRCCVTNLQLMDHLIAAHRTWLTVGAKAASTLRNRGSQGPTSS